jgi:hypothetical protein
LPIVAADFDALSALLWGVGPSAREPVTSRRVVEALCPWGGGEALERAGGGPCPVGALLGLLKDYSVGPEVPVVREGELQGPRVAGRVLPRVVVAYDRDVRLDALWTDGPTVTLFEGPPKVTHRRLYYAEWVIARDGAGFCYQEDGTGLKFADATVIRLGAFEPTAPAYACFVLPRARLGRE